MSLFHVTQNLVAIKSMQSNVLNAQQIKRPLEHTTGVHKGNIKIRHKICSSDRHFFSGK